MSLNTQARHAVIAAAALAALASTEMSAGRTDAGQRGDVPDRHGGYNLAASIGLPQRFGYRLVTSIGVDFQSRVVVDYHYSVEPSPTTATRPVFRGDDSLNLVASVEALAPLGQQ